MKISIVVVHDLTNDVRYGAKLNTHVGLKFDIFGVKK